MPAGPALSSPLVSTQWLADHLGADGLVVVDASVVAFAQPDGSTGYLTGHEQFILDGHLPGAVFADLIDELSDPDGAYPFTRPSSARFAAAAGALGVGPDTTVVIYDSQHGQWAARVWWLLRWAGHDRAAVLDGGLTAWRLEGRALDTGHVEPAARAFAVHERRGVWADKAEVEAVVRGEVEAVLVCSTPPKDFSGEIVTRARAGRIPGSISAAAGMLVADDTRVARPADELRALLGPAVTAPRVIAYCGGGIAATAAALALTQLGQTEVAVYDGSLAEWVADPEAPLETAVPTGV
jgi:thiosulfate/3-mercaptopyruvate sulfurtransferase